MELRHLRYFVAVAEELNFTRAAEKLRLAQPSLTRQVHNLEIELGVKLINREKSHISLTEEGRRFLMDARRLVNLSLESVKSIQSFSRGESSQLNLGYLFKFNLDLLPKTLSTFYLACPKVAVNLFDMSPAKQLNALEAREIDLAFVGIRPPPNKKIVDLGWECVAHHKVVVVLPEKHPLTKKRKIEMSDLEPLPFVAMSEATHPGWGSWLSGLCRSSGFLPRILQEVELEPGLMTFVAEGLGVTLAREQIDDLPHPGVVFRPLRTAAKVDHWIAWHRENHSKALRQYIEVVKKQAAKRK